MKSPIWILCTERTGSSYLADLLNKFFGKYQFAEWFNFAIDSQLYNNYYYHDNDNNIQGIPRYAKVIHSQFEKLFEDKDKQEIERHLPGIKYIHLYRKDVIGQALSIYFANIACRWNFTNQEDLNNYKSRRIPYNETYLLRVYDYAKECNFVWDNFLKGTVSFDIDYSELNNIKKIKLLLEFLDLSIMEKDLIKILNEINLIKINRPETDDYRARLNRAINENSKNISHHMVRPKIFI